MYKVTLRLAALPYEHTFHVTAETLKKIEADKRFVVLHAIDIDHLITRWSFFDEWAKP